MSQVPVGFVGFIGLGNMGSNMAQHLLNRGHRLIVYDVFPEAMAKLTDRGIYEGIKPI